MKSSKSGSKKITTTVLMIPSMIAATLVAGATMLDMSAAYALNPESNACKTQNNPQGKLNSNPNCVDDPVQGPPVPSSNAAGFQDDSQVQSTACENTGDNPNTPAPCLSGSRRR